MANIDVFISRKSEDAALAKELYHFLIAQGLNVFDSDETLPKMGNTDYLEAIDKALVDCQHMIVMGSSVENFISRWVKKEWSSFVNEKMSGRKNGNLLTVINGNLKIDDLPLSLRNYQVITFDKSNFERIAAYLGKSITENSTHNFSSPKPEVKPIVQSSVTIQQQYIPHGNMKVSEVPPSIRFGNEILNIPTFEQAGLNGQLFYFGIVSSPLSVGTWVNRGDKLLDVTVHIYSKSEKPKYFWNKDYTYPVSFSLNSPASGLVIGMQEEYVGYFAQYTMGVEPLVYGNKDIFPVILIPDNEPPLNLYVLDFYKELDKFLNKEWQLIRFSHREKGYIRAKDVFSENEINNKKQTLKELNIRDMYINGNYRLDSNIQSLRTQYLDLRDKLFHLIKE